MLTGRSMCVQRSEAEPVFESILLLVLEGFPSGPPDALAAACHPYVDMLNQRTAQYRVMNDAQSSCWTLTSFYEVCWFCEWSCFYSGRFSAPGPHIWRKCTFSFCCSLILARPLARINMLRSFRKHQVDLVTFGRAQRTHSVYTHRKFHCVCMSVKSRVSIKRLAFDFCLATRLLRRIILFCVRVCARVCLRHESVCAVFVCVLRELDGEGSAGHKVSWFPYSIYWIQMD